MHIQSFKAAPNTFKKQVFNASARFFARLSDMRTFGGVQKARFLFNLSGMQPRLDMTFTPMRLAHLPALKVTPKKLAHTPYIILYCHGGGYVAGSTKSHRSIAANFAKACAMPAIVYEYRLAPEHTFPAQFDDSFVAYKALLDLGYSADNIILMGESAGGAIVMDLLVQLRTLNMPLPPCAVALFPWADYTMRYASAYDNSDKELLLPTNQLKLLADQSFNNNEAEKAKHNVIDKDFSNLPPVLVQVGTYDTLYGCGEALINKLDQAGNMGEGQYWEQMPHGWHAFIGFYPEAMQAINHIGDFVKKHLD